LNPKMIWGCLTYFVMVYFVTTNDDYL
jgi:hypothetical protein